MDDIPVEVLENIRSLYNKLDAAFSANSVKLSGTCEKISTIPTDSQEWKDFMNEFNNHLVYTKQIFEEFNSTIVVLALTLEYLTYSMENKVPPEVFTIIKIERGYEKGKISPMVKYQLRLAEMEMVYSMIHVYHLINSLDTASLSKILWSHFNLNNIDLGFSDSDVLDWISLNKCLVKLKGLIREFEKFKHKKEGERFFPEHQISQTVRRLVDVSRTIFNHHKIRSNNSSCGSMLDSSELGAFSDHLSHLTTIISRSSWDSLDIGLDPAYLQLRDYNQQSFRNICRKLLPEYRHFEIDGDGNCFYRAVVKYFWENCPKEQEEQYSLVLRQFLNPSPANARKRKRSTEHLENDHDTKKEKLSNSSQSVGASSGKDGGMEIETDTKEEASNGNINHNILLVNGTTMEVDASSSKQNTQEIDGENIFKSFEEEGISDASTMRKRGVWADHLQVLKLSAYTDRPVWLYRFDDCNIHWNENGDLIPGPDYRIRMQFKSTQSTTATTTTSSTATVTPAPVLSTAPSTEIDNPITLYFIPETHYEVLKKVGKTCPPQSSAEALTLWLNNDFNSFNSKPLDAANSIIQLVFALQGDISEARGWSEQIMTTDDVSLRMDLRPILEERIKTCRENIYKFCESLKLLPADFLARVEEKDKFRAVVLEPIISEKLDLSPITLTPNSRSTQTGIFYGMYQKLKYYDDNKYTTVSSSFTSPSSSSFEKGASYLDHDRTLFPSSSGSVITSPSSSSSSSLVPEEIPRATAVYDTTSQFSNKQEHKHIYTENTMNNNSDFNNSNITGCPHEWNSIGKPRVASRILNLQHVDQNNHWREISAMSPAETCQICFGNFNEVLLEQLFSLASKLGLSKLRLVNCNFSGKACEELDKCRNIPCRLELEDCNLPSPIMGDGDKLKIISRERKI